MYTTLKSRSATARLTGFSPAAGIIVDRACSLAPREGLPTVQFHLPFFGPKGCGRGLRTDYVEHGSADLRAQRRTLVESRRVAWQTPIVVLVSTLTLANAARWGRLPRRSASSRLMRHH